VGISGLWGFVAYGLMESPERTSIAVLVLLLGVSIFVRKVESRRPDPRLFGWVVLGAIMLNPAHLAPGLVLAYFCAWVGHDQLDGNRRTLLTYPAWSLMADFRLYFLMLRGRLWTRASFARAEF